MTRLINFRWNPCTSCGVHVNVLGATLCLDCLCRKLDEAGVVLGRPKPFEFADIDRDLAPWSKTECKLKGIRHSSEDDDTEITIGSNWPMALAFNNARFG